MNQVRDLLAEADLPGDSARLDAELLLCHCLNKPRSYLYTWPERAVPTEHVQHYRELVQSRREGRPLAYILGEREFWSLSLLVNENTLIPRPETETLVQWALELPLAATSVVADWGTGSGAIALALASERPSWQVLASDFSPDAVAVAVANGQRLALDSVQFLIADWGRGLGENSLDLVASNPPYVASGDPHLVSGDLPHEPESALVAGSDGLDAIRQIVSLAAQCLRPQGWLLLEHGYDQADEVRSLLRAAGFTDVESRADLAAIERITGGRLQ